MSSRIVRLWRSSDSFGNLASKIIEEVYCRFCDRAGIRRMLSCFVTQRQPEKWVFIVGCYNSGTTLLQKILSAHPAISGLPREGVRFTDGLSNLELNDHHMFWDESWREHANPPPEESQKVAALVKRDWSIFWARGCNIFLEKSIANTARIEWLDRHFPNAHFIGLHRNGYCIAEGLHRRSRPPAWLVEQTGRYSYSLEMAAEQWATTNTAMLYGLNHVDRKMTLSFEDFVANPVEEANRIFEFLGVAGAAAATADGLLCVGTERFTVRNTNTASLERLGDRKPGIESIVEPMMARLADSSCVKKSTSKRTIA